MLAELKELWRFRELLIILVKRDLYVRYKNTVGGFAWSLINPLLQVIVITVVLKYVMRFDVPNYSAYIFCAFLPWSFFQLGLLDASTSLLFHERLIRKVYFPREVIPLSLVISNLIHFALATLVFLIYMALLPFVLWPFSHPHRFEIALQPALVLAPVIMLVEFFLVAGLSFFVSATNLFFEDVRYLLTVGLSILYYAVPVIYFPEFVAQSRGLEELGPRWRDLIYGAYMLNPLSTLISTFRKWILVPTFSGNFSIRTEGMTELDYFFLAAAVASSVVIALSGYAYFNRKKWSFAERP